MRSSQVIDYLNDAGEHLPQPLKPALRRGRDLANGWWPPVVADWRLSRVPRDPVTFTEKVRYRVAYDRRPILTTFADKVGMRDYVTDRVGAEHVTHAYGIYDRPQDIDWTALPREYACKASHGSGAMVLVADSAPESRRLPSSARFVDWERFLVRPEHAVPQRIETLAAKWLTLNYHRGPGRLPEWAYRDVRPRLLVEELLHASRGGLASDWKCFVFDGKVHIVTVQVDRFGDHREEVFRRDGTRDDACWTYPKPDLRVARPDNFDTVVAVAEELGRGIDFVRVDLYNVEGRILVGELTNYPGAGNQAFLDPDLDRQLGAVWTLAT